MYNPFRVDLEPSNSRDYTKKISISLTRTEEILEELGLPNPIKKALSNKPKEYLSALDDLEGPKLTGNEGKLLQLKKPTHLEDGLSPRSLTQPNLLLSNDATQVRLVQNPTRLSQPTRVGDSKDLTKRLVNFPSSISSLDETRLEVSKGKALSNLPGLSKGLTPALAIGALLLSPSIARAQSAPESPTPVVNSNEYISIEEFGGPNSRVRRFLESNKGIYGGFYQAPDKRSEEAFIRNLDPSKPLVVPTGSSDERGEDTRGLPGFIARVRRAHPDINISTEASKYHAKFFGGVDPSSGDKTALVLTGNLSKSALDIGAPTSREETKVGLLENIMLRVSNVLPTGYEGRKYQVNIGFETKDPRLLKQLDTIYDQVASTGRADSTKDFIVGGPGNNSGSKIAELITSNAKGQDIEVMAPYISDPNVVQALIKAKREGSRVRVITSNPESLSPVLRPPGSTAAQLASLQAAGVEIYAPDADQNLLVHAKAIKVGDLVIAGSHNFTITADKKQVEISRVIYDPAISRLFSKDFETVIGLVGDQKQLDPKLIEAARVKQLGADGVISPAVATGFAQEGSLLVPTNMGATYFYARSLYNVSMRQAGLNNRTISNDDSGIASSMYKMAYLIKNGRAATSMPIAYSAFDKELTSSGLGALFNEYISMPMGMGRLYKDEMGVIPSVLAGIGAQLDKSYLFYVSPKDLPGINTLTDPLDPSDTFYKERQSPMGLFESTLGFGSSFVLTTAGAVGLYLTAGEPLNLIASEAMRANLQEQIDEAIPSNSGSVAKFNTFFSRITRQTALGLGTNTLDPNTLRRNLLYNLYEVDPTSNAVKKSGSSYYDVDNFAISPYHLNSVFRARAQTLLSGIMQPFLMEIVNPYKHGHDIDYRNKLDNLIYEIGSPVRLEAVFVKGTQEATLSEVFRVRESARAAYDSAYVNSKNILSSKDKKLSQLSDLTSKSIDALKAHKDGTSPLSRTERQQLSETFKELKKYKKLIKGAEVWQSTTTIDTLINDALYGDPRSASLLGPDGNPINNERNPELGAAISSVQFLIRNAGEERQMAVAKALQSVLDEVPLNPFRWRVFSAFNGGLIDAVDGPKPYVAIGDIFSFEEATQAIRNITLGTGGVRSLLAKYEVNRDTTADSSLGRVSKNIVDSIHTFWNLTIKSPVEALQSLRERSRVVKSLHKTTAAFKSMEYSLLAISTNQTKAISFANDINSVRFQDHLQKLIKDPLVEQEALDNLNTQAARKGLSGQDRSVYVRDNLNTEINTIASRRISPDMDPFTREIGYVDDSVTAALAQLSELQSSDALSGKRGAILLASEAQHFRAQALGVMSINSQSTLKRRLNRIKAGLGSDPTSKITKRNLFTYVAVGLAVSSALDSLFSNTTGVSLLTQIMTANQAARDQLDLSIDFSNGPLVGFGGTLGKSITAAAGVGITYWAARWMATAMQDVDGVTYGLNNKVMGSLVDKGLSLTHVSSGRVIGASEIASATETGLFRLEGKIGSQSIGMNLSREVGQSLDNSLFKLNVARLTGNTVRNSAIWFTALSLGGGFAKNMATWAISSSRDYTSSADPILGTIAGAAVGRIMGKSFTGGVIGALAGLTVGMSLNALTGIKVLGLGDPGTTVNPVNLQIAAELNNYKALIREKGVDKASRLELMAAIYAGKYADIFSILGGKSSRGNTQVIARQAPLPFLQFFMAESIKGEFRDADGNITQQGQRYLSVGIQSAPILGMSFNVGLPVKIVPGGGYFNLAYNDKNNLAEAAGGLQTAVGTALLGLQLAKLFIKGTNALGSKFLGKSAEIGVPAFINTMGAGLKAVETIGKELLVGTPSKVAYWMYGTDIDMAHRIAPQLMNRRFSGSRSLASASEVAAPSLSRQAMILPFVMKAMAGGFIGSFIGGTLAALSSSTAMSDEQRSNYLGAGQLAGLIGGAVALPLYSAVRSIPSAVVKAQLDPVNDLIKTNPRISKPLNNIKRLVKPPLKLTRALTKTVGSGSFRKAIPFVGAAIAAAFLTDSSFGVTNNMDNDGLGRIATAAIYAGIVGTVASKIGGFGYNSYETIDRWERLQEARVKLSSAKSVPIITQVRSWLLDVVSKSVESDVDSLVRVIHSNQGEIERLASKAPEGAPIKSLKELSDKIELNSKKGIENVRLTKSLVEDGSDLSYKDISRLFKAGRSAYLSGRTTPMLFTNRAWRTGMVLSAIPVVFSMLTGALGGGDSNKTTGNIYNFLDDKNPKNPLLSTLSNSVGNVLRLLTGTDSTYVDPAGYSSLTRTYRSSQDSGGYGNQLVSGKRLNKPLNNPGSRVNQLFKDMESMFVLDPSNAFIQVIAPVGFTFRSGEYGTRTNMYMQLQTPGADISTATYSMAAAFSFKEALMGNYNKLLEVQNTFKQLNQNLRAGTTDAQLLRKTAVSILGLTAMQDTAKKRRKYSSISRQSLDMISVDPILSGALKDRHNNLKSMSFQTYASLGNRMLTQAMENHSLSNRGLLASVLSGDANALSTLLRDPFGLISRNVLIKDMKVYSPNRSSGASNELESQSYAALDEVDAMQVSIGLDYYQQQASKNPLSALVSPLVGGLWNSLGNSVHPIAKWAFITGVGGALGWAALHNIGSWATSKQNSNLINEVNEFYNQKWYNIEQVEGKNGKVYRSMPMSAEVLKTPTGAHMRVLNGRRVVMSKGATYFDINQTFSKSEVFLNNLNDGLEGLQTKLNQVNQSFLQRKKAGITLSFADYLMEDQKVNRLAGHLNERINLASELEAKPRDIVINELKSHYRKAMRAYVNKYVAALSGVYIDLPQELHYIPTNGSAPVKRVSLLALMTGNAADADTLAKLSELKGNKAVDAILPFLTKGSAGSKEGFTNSLMKQIDDLVDTVLNTEVANGKAGVVDTNRLLSNGAQLDLENSLKYITSKVLHELQAGNSSPFYLLRHNLGGLVTTPTNDLVVKATETLGRVVRNVREGITGAPSAASAMGAKVINIGTSGRVNAGTKLIDVTGKVVTTGDIADASKASKANYKVLPDGLVEVEFYDSSNTRRVVQTSRSTLDTIDDLARGGNVRPVSSSAKAITDAKYGKGPKMAFTGALRTLEIASFSNDILDSINIFSAFTRAGGSYTKGTFTQAQRKNAMDEAGMVTTNVALQTMMALGIMKGGALLASAGAGVVAASGGLIAAGAAGVGAGAATAAAVVSAPAWILGGLAISAVGLALTAGYHFMPEGAKKSLTDTIGALWKGTSQLIGSGIQLLGDTANKLAGPRAASGAIMGVGGLLGGAVIGIGLAAISALALPALATIGAAAALGAGIGATMGLIAPNLGSSLSTSLINFLSAIPVVGSWVNKPGSWLSSVYKQPRDGPMFVGTASDAIQSEYSQRIEAASSDTSGGSTSRYMVSSTLYGSSTITSPFLAKGGDLSDMIRPGSMIDPTLDREIKIRGQLYNQTIIGRYQWRTMLRNSSNYSVIREADQHYKNRQAQATVRAQEIINEARQIRNTPVAKRSEGNNLLVQEVGLAQYVLAIGTEVAKDKEASKNALIVNIKPERVPATSSAAHARDTIHRTNKPALTNKVTTLSNGSIHTTAQVDQDRELASVAVRNPTTSTPD